MFEGSLLDGGFLYMRIAGFAPASAVQDDAHAALVPKDVCERLDAIGVAPDDLALLPRVDERRKAIREPVADTKRHGLVSTQKRERYVERNSSVTVRDNLGASTGDSACKSQDLPTMPPNSAYNGDNLAGLPDDLLP